MSIDLFPKVISQKNAYEKSRGVFGATGIKNLFSPGHPIPRTTWEDALLLSSHFNKYFDPTIEDCISILVKDRGYDLMKATTTCTFPGPQNPTTFVRTDDFKRAKANFASVHPFQKGGGPFGVLGKLGRMEEYPYNEEFWGYALRYANARAAAGEVPFWNDIAAESIKEAIKELPATVQGAATTAFNTVKDTAGLIPKTVGALTEMFKWGAIGGGLFMLYWYVLRPSKS